MQQIVDVTFEEAAFGTKKKLNITKMEKCSTCNGSGAKPGTSPETCSFCNGTGQTVQQQRTMFGFSNVVSTCQHCHGTGKIIKEPCRDCRGTGKVRKQKQIEVSIPAGIDNGQTIQITEQVKQGTEEVRTEIFLLRFVCILMRYLSVTAIMYI